MRLLNKKPRPNPDMQLNTTAQPIYLPEADQSAVARLGLHPLAASEWVDVDGDFIQFHSHKVQQHRLRPQSVYGQLPGSEAAVAELGKLLQQHLLTEHAADYALTNNGLQHRPSGLQFFLPAENLWQISLWVQEDICLLQQINDEFLLTAASVCSPSNWHPADKLGRGLDKIHQPVPGYEEQLSRRVNALFAAMKPGKPLLRYNWSLQPGNELYWRDKLAPRDPAAAQYWRVERQTLRRLPETGAIVFMIRIYLHRRSDIERDPEVKQNLQALLERLAADEKVYKGLA